MQSYFQSVLAKTELIQSDVEVRVVLIASVRHLLQMVNYSVLEWIAARNPEPDLQPPSDLLRDLLAPSDGSLVAALESLLVCAEQNGWAGVYRPLVSEVRARDECLDICGDHPNTLNGLLKALVELRNDGGEGHGLPGAYRRKEEVAAYRFVLEQLRDMLPRFSGGDIEVGPSGREVRVRMLRVFCGTPVLVRKIRLLNSASVRVQGKYYNEQGELVATSYEAWNPFSRFVGQSLPTLREYPNAWDPLCYLPERITDTFVGRAEERGAIVEWLNDEESRACLVFGDGNDNGHPQIRIFLQVIGHFSD